MHLTTRPADALRPYVSAYTGFEMRGMPPGTHLGLPGRSITLVVSLSEELDVLSPHAPLPRCRHHAIAGGLTARSVAIRHDGHQHGVRVSLTPEGSRAILGMPASALTHEVVALDEVLGPLGDELGDRLRARQTWPGRFAILDEVLARRLAVTGDRRIRPEVAEAWRRLVHHRGQLRIDALAADLGWSRRHLSDRFRAEIGMPPKAIARVLRLEHAAELAASRTRSSWAEIAAMAGYADQAHLVREWRAATGGTPTEWQRRDAMATPPTPWTPAPVDPFNEDGARSPAPA